MTALRAVNADAGEVPPAEAAGHVLGAEQALLDEQTVLLAARIESAFLAEAGWDPCTRVLTIDPAHPLLGRNVCRAPGCQTTCPAGTGVCLDCRRRLGQAGLGLEDAGLLPPPHGRRWLVSATGPAGSPAARVRG